MKNKTIIIIAVVALLLLIGIGIWAAQSSKTVVTPTPPPAPTPTAPGDSIINTLGSLFSKWFGKKATPPPYVQVLPIDEDGCDALGYNKIGVKCFGAF